MKKTLIVVDMQRDFINGSLGTKEAEAIVDRVKSKIEACRKNGDEVIFTRDTHQENYLETNEGRHLPVIHCVKGTPGWEIDPRLDTSGSMIIDKPTFAYNGWAEYGFQDVELVGLCTDICVISNALMIKALYPEIRVSVDANCCAGVTPESHAAALLVMKMCQVDVSA